MVRYILINYPDKIRDLDDFKEKAIVYLNQILKAYKIKRVINIESEYEDKFDLKVWYKTKEKL